MVDPFGTSITPIAPVGASPDAGLVEIHLLVPERSLVWRPSFCAVFVESARYEL
jgi:hypothetical protein